MNNQFVVFWQYGCWQCHKRTRTRVKHLANLLLCFDCRLALEYSSQRPSALPRAEVCYEYSCGLCRRVVEGTWPADRDTERKLRMRVKRQRCLDCFNTGRRMAKAVKSISAQASRGLPTSSMSLTTTPSTPPGVSRVCLHGTPAEHCAYCNPGRYPYRPWRNSNL
jgi:hypothetical protein